MIIPRGRLARKTGSAIVGLLLVAALAPAAFAATVSQYVMSPTPIAAAGSLTAGASVSVTVSAEDATKALVPGAVVYLSFSQALGGGTAAVGTTALGKTPIAFTATSGTITVTYTAPATLPASGRDTIKAGNTASLPTMTALDTYDFAAPITILMSPNPIGAPASLAAGASVAITLTAETALAAPIPGATVYLSFTPTTGGGSASVGTTALTSTPTSFVANTSGQLTITYQAPATLPTTGTDTVTAQQSPTSSKRTDSYSFAAAASMTFSPTPIAASSSLTPGQIVAVTLTAKDASGNPVAGQAVFLTFVPGTSGGTAMTGKKALSATPIQTRTDSSGLVVVTYTASTSSQVGVDTLTASNAKTGGSITATDTYSASPVGPLNHLVLSPAKATVNPGVAEAYTATGYDAGGNVIGDVTSATTFSIAGGTCTGSSCSASTAGDHTVTGTDGAATGTATLTVSGVLGATSGDTYHPLTPARILDTRNGTGGLGIFHSHVPQGFTVWGAGGVPANATAVTGNLTVTGQTSLGFLSIGPVAQINPTSSTLNFPVADDRANSVTVALSGSGELFITYGAPVVGTPTAQVIFDVTGYFTADTSGSTYVPLSPSRILDTRNGTGGLGLFHSHVPQALTVWGAGGVPSGALAVTGNLTVTQQTSLGFLSVGPVSQVNPTSSNLNFPVGDDRAAAVTVALSGSGRLFITYGAPTSSPTAQVLFDVTGYFVAGTSGALYVPLSPARILDTRNDTGGLGAFASHTPQGFGVWGAGGVPNTAVAVTGNLTVTEQTSLGFLSVGPAAQANPTSSNLNFPVRDDRANAVTVELSSAGKLDVTYGAPTTGPTAQVIFDVTGYFVP